jgi:uncharacterized membrane protein
MKKWLQVFGVGVVGGPKFQALNNGVPAPDVTPFYDIDFLNNFFKTLSPQAIEYFKNTFSVVDIFYPIAYTLVFLIAINYFLKKLNINNTKWKYLLVLPLLMIGFDYLENIFTLLSISNLPSINTTYITLETLFSSVKWAMSGIISVVIVMLLLSMFFKKKS